MLNLRKLPFDIGANEILSEDICVYHYERYKACVQSLNAMVQGTKFEHSTLYDIIMNAQDEPLKSAVQIYNYDFLLGLHHQKKPYESRF